MSSQDTDELVHTVMHIAQLAQGVHLPALYAHVSDYDPKTHAVRVLIPAYQGGNAMGTLTNWIPLMSPMVGNGFGVQMALHGGANYTNPTAGELVALLVMDDESGAFLAALPFFTPKMLPPGNNQTLNPGELLIKHESGSNLYFDQNGNMTATSKTTSSTLELAQNGDIKITSGSTVVIVNHSGAVTIALNGSNNVNITGSGTPLLELGAGGDALALVSKLVTAFNSHTHPVSGSVTGTPAVPWTPTTIESTKASTDG